MRTEYLDYLEVWRLRKAYFLIPALVIAIVTTIVAYHIPPVYESASTILIQQQQIPPEYVRSTVTGVADTHIQIITQQILSSPKLQEIINQFNLYSDLKGKSTKEQILEKMRKSIKIKTISAEINDKRQGQAGITIAFSVSFQGDHPETVQKVAGTLTSLYLEQNLKNREAQAQTTTNFLQAELKGLREQIRELGDEIATYKEKHEGTLPELQQFNLGQVDRLENDIKRLENAIQAAEGNKTVLEGLLETLKSDSSEKGSEGEKNPQARLQALEAQLTGLRAKFSEEHPDIKNALREKAQLENLIKSKKGGDLQDTQNLIQLQAELAQKQALYSDNHPEVRKLKNEIAKWSSGKGKTGHLVQEINSDNPSHVKLVTQIQAARQEISFLRQQRQDLQEKLKLYQQRLEETPKVEQKYLALQRDYQNAHSKYQEVMNKLLEARIAEGMEEHQKGEKFTLIDPASYPGKPIKPNRPVIILAGLIFGCVAGVGLMATVEMLDHSIKSSDELAWLTEMPPLGAVPKIETPHDLALKSRRQRLLWTTALVSLVLGLLLFHFFYMDLTILMTKFFGITKKVI